MTTSLSSSSQPTLIIVTDEKTFEISPWTREGYAVHLLTQGTKRDIENATDDLESNDPYAILAFGRAASGALAFAVTPSRLLRAVAAYYPSTLPQHTYHPEVQILIHLPSSTSFSAPESPTLRIRTYDDVSPGFAEHTLATYDRHATSLSFSRTLALLRSTVGPLVDLEAVWDEHVLSEFKKKDLNKVMGTMSEDPYVNHVATCTGGVGYTDLYRFYKDYFIPNNPQNMKITPVSRTVGSDRVVDEMVLKFRHTCEMPYFLPGVKPTDKEIEIAVVSIVRVAGGKLYHEHVYWDQASVLVQLGLLNPEGLPVAGRESARKLLDVRAVESNKLIPNW